MKVSKLWEQKQVLQRQLRRQGLYLICSLIFNAALLLIIIVEAFLSTLPETKTFSYQPVEDSAIQEGQVEMGLLSVWQEYSKKSYQKLLEDLEQKQWVAPGIQARELALSVLYTLYDVDVYKAFGLKELSLSRKDFYHPQYGLKGFYFLSGTTEAQFAQLSQFLKVEKWPYSAKGLFNRLKSGLYKDKSLREAFFNTDEFYTFYTLMNGEGGELNKKETLALILQGTWEMLELFYLQQREKADLSEYVRRKVLLDYIAVGSSLATDYFLNIEGEFALENFQNKHIRVFLRQMSRDNRQAKQFLQNLLKDPKRKDLWTKAERLLKEGNVNQQLSWQGGEGPKPESISAKQEVLHYVQKDETLWAIAKLYQVEVSKIKAYNGFEGDIVYESQPLKIPVLR